MCDQQRPSILLSITWSVSESRCSLVLAVCLPFLRFILFNSALPFPFPSFTLPLPLSLHLRACLRFASRCGHSMPSERCARHHAFLFRCIHRLVPLLPILAMCRQCEQLRFVGAMRRLLPGIAMPKRWHWIASGTGAGELHTRRWHRPQQNGNGG